MSDNKQNYKYLSLEQLYKERRKIDREKNPDKFNELQRVIDELLSNPSIREDLEKRNMIQYFIGSGKHKKLLLIDIILNAFTLPWQKRWRLIRALFIPSLLTIGIGILLSFKFFDTNPRYMFPLAIISGMAHTIIAVTCHRLVLMGEESIPKYGLMRWSMRETRFAGWEIGIGLIILVTSFLPAYILFSIIGISISQELTLGNELLLYVAMIPGSYIPARLSLLFPSTALGNRHNMSWSWNQSRENGWRLVLIASVLPWLFYFVKNVLIREGATFIEVSLGELIGILFLIIEIVVISLSYQSLVTERKSILENK